MIECFIIPIFSMGKSSAQGFTLWQQAAIEITCHDHSFIACSRHIYMVLFFAHIPFVVNRTINATANFQPLNSTFCVDF